MVVLLGYLEIVILWGDFFLIKRNFMKYYKKIMIIIAFMGIIGLVSSNNSMSY